jgi:ribosome-associated toxin RatA of RatAB toxin-antitoxin module
VQTVHRVFINAPSDTVFALARDVESWPRLLPQYRWCRVIERRDNGVTFSMGGWIRGWPARWTARQECSVEARRIHFRHLQGITRGMQVEWRFDPRPAGVDVELVHALEMAWPLIGRPVGNLVVGPVFIDWIARKTLAAIKDAAERAASGIETGGGLL